MVQNDVYDKGLFRVHRNRLDKQIYDGCNVEQVIEKISQPLVRRKSRYLQVMHKKVHRTGKPACTGFGIINPIKLDISNLRKGESKND